MKKRTLIMAIGLTMAMVLTGCKSDDYNKAVSSYEEGNYEEAITLFESLGDYKDSADQLTESKYQLAMKLQEEGSYDDAIALYDELGDYNESASNKENCLYAKAEQLIADKNYEEALNTIADYTTGDTGKHLADICNVHINGMEGLVTYIQDNIELNDDGDNAKSVYVTPKGTFKILVYYVPGEKALKLEIAEKDRKTGDPLLTLTLTGENAGKYHYMQSSLKEVSSAYAYYNDTLMIGNKYYIGYTSNGDGKINLAKYKKGDEIKVDNVSLMESTDGVSGTNKKEAKKLISTFVGAMVDVGFEGLQQFINEEDLRISINELGIDNYKCTVAEDPYSTKAAPAATGDDASADTTEEKDAGDDKKDGGSSAGFTTEGVIDVSTSTGKAVYKDAYYAPEGFITEENYDNSKALIIDFDYTNLEDESKQFQNDFYIRAYQNGVEIDSSPCSYNDENAPTISNFFKNVLKDGTITIGNWYYLTDDSPVTVILEDNGCPEEVNEKMIINLK